MKPDWKDAPEWANYLTQDCDGRWYWWEHKPIHLLLLWYTDKGQCRKAELPNWDESLEEKPTK